VTRLYFAYGANMSRESMIIRCPQAQPLRAFRLRGWQLDLCGHATISPHPGKEVPGVLWRITDECEASLDRFEGYPYYYRKRILVQDGQEFMVYLMNDPVPGQPTQGYLDLLAEGYQDWKLDIQYLESAVDRIINPAYNIDKQWNIYEKHTAEL
jgi:gamma-glutamylcyclotransferase